VKVNQARGGLLRWRRPARCASFDRDSPNWATCGSRNGHAKSCHHSSSDFTVDYLKLVGPHVNVVSSGDNKSFDHPTADAVGAAARWTSGTLPLFFSTELGRARTTLGVHYGLVNLRSNGTELVAAKMKEQHKNKSDVWDSFTVPWKGKFPDAV